MAWGKTNSNAGSPILLWENLNIYDEFLPKTINIPGLKKYNSIIIEYVFSHHSTGQSLTIPNDLNVEAREANLTAFLTLDKMIYISSRSAVLNDDGITFDKGFLMKLAPDTSGENEWFMNHNERSIPVKIYGVMNR